MPHLFSVDYHCENSRMQLNLSCLHGFDSLNYCPCDVGNVSWSRRELRFPLLVDFSRPVEPRWLRQVLDAQWCLWGAAGAMGFGLATAHQQWFLWADRGGKNENLQSFKSKWKLCFWQCVSRFVLLKLTYFLHNKYVFKRTKSLK